MTKRKTTAEFNPNAGEEPAREDPESQPHKGSGRQQELPGVVDAVAVLPDVTRAAKRLRELRSEWQELGGKVEKAKDALIEKMHAHGIKSYIAAGLRIELVEGKESVKIREVGEEADADAA